MQTITRPLAPSPDRRRRRGGLARLAMLASVGVTVATMVVIGHAPGTRDSGPAGALRSGTVSVTISWQLECAPRGENRPTVERHSPRGGR